MFKTSKSDGSTQFERTFADIAYGSLRESAPKLLDFIQGFQVLDKEDDETRAAGVFTFEVDNKKLMAPVFFLNGELKGKELLVVQSDDTFVPLTESWVSYIISRRPPSLGASSGKSPSEVRGMQPDLSVFYQSPLVNGSKFACAEFSDEKRGWRHGSVIMGEPVDITYLLATAAAGPMDVEYKKMAEHIDLRQVIKEIPWAKAALLRTIASRPSFGDALLRFYKSAELFPEAVAAVLRKQELEKQAAEEPKDNTPEPQPAPSGSVVVVRTADVDTDPDVQLSDSSREDLVRSGFTVLDDRKVEDTTDVFSTRRLNQLCNPTASGIHQLITSDNSSVHECYVFQAPVTIGRGSSTGALVVSADDGAWKLAMMSELFAATDPQSMQHDTWAKRFETLPKVDSMSVGSTYTIVDSAGAASVPFTVYRKDGDEYRVGESGDLPCTAPYGCGHVYPEIQYALPSEYDENTVPKTFKPKGYKGDEFYGGTCYRVVVIAKGVRGMTRIGSRLLVSPDARVVELKYYSGMPFRFGAADDVVSLIYKRANLMPMTLRSNGVYTKVSSAHGEFESAREADLVERLVMVEGLTGKAAKGILKAAAATGEVDYAVKYAQGYAPAVSSYMPTGTYDPNLGAVSVGPQQSDVPVEGMMDPGPEIPADSAQAAESAGDKTLADAAVLTGLLRLGDPIEHINKFLTDLTVGLDRLGRLLFLYYWHNKAFEERYGAKELKELEDSLQTSFKNLGELVMFMRKRETDPDRGLRGSDVRLDTAAV